MLKYKSEGKNANIFIMGLTKTLIFIVYTFPNTKQNNKSKKKKKNENIELFRISIQCEGVNCLFD